MSDIKIKIEGLTKIFGHKPQTMLEHVCQGISNVSDWPGHWPVMPIF